MTGTSKSQVSRLPDDMTRPKHIGVLETRAAARKCWRQKNCDRRSTVAREVRVTPRALANTPQSRNASPILDL
jgi:hypothetical protein